MRAAARLAIVVLALGGFGALASEPAGGEEARAARAGDGDGPSSQGRMGESPGAIASRAAARVAAAADAAQAASMRSDAASLARMGALPASMVKWGQLRSPWAEGQFMDIQIEGSGPGARVAVVAPSIPASLCAQSVAELAMSPQLEKVEAGAWSLAVGKAWSIKDLDGLCQALAAGPVRLWAKRPKMER